MTKATPFMTNYHPGNVVLIAFPFSAGSQTKDRPALVIVDTGDADVLVGKITRRVFSTSYDVNLTDWQTAGLLAPSVLRLHKLATIDKKYVRRLLGTLGQADHSRVSAALKQIFGNW
jgi:mRNA interferase MazF